MFEHIKRLFSHSITYGIGRLASIGVSFIMVPVYTRLLTPRDYGILELLNTFSNILIIFLGMGCSSALFKCYLLDCQTEDERDTLVSTTFIFLVTVLVPFLTILFLNNSCLSSLLFKTKDYFYFVSIVLATCFFEILLFLPTGIMRAEEKSKWFVIYSLTQLITTLTLNIIFVVVLRMGVFGAIISGLLSTGLVCIVALFIFLPKKKWGFSIDYVKKLLSFGLPLVVASLSSWIMDLSDRYFISHFTNLHDVGLYGLGSKIGQVIQFLVIGPFCFAWPPFMFSISKEKNAKEIYSAVFTYIMFLSAGFALSVSLLARDVIIIISDPAFIEAYRIVPLIAISYILNGAYFIFVLGINLVYKTYYCAIITTIGAGLSLCLNFLLVPHYGMIGAACTKVISFLVMALSAYIISERFYHVPYDFWRVVKILICAIGLYWIGNGINMNPLFSIGLKGLLLLLFPIILYPLGFYTKDEIQKVKEKIGRVISSVEGSRKKYV